MAQLSIHTPLAYQAIKRQLAERLGHEWKAGHRLPPISELARILNAGQVNTHRAVRELVNEGFLISRPRLGTIVAPLVDAEKSRALLDRGFVGTRRLGATVGRQVRVLTGGHPDKLIRTLIDSFTESLAASGCTVTTATFNPMRPDFSQGADAAADALVIVNPYATQNLVCGPKQVMTVINTGLECPVAMPGRFDVVSVDQEQGGFLAGELLRDAGCETACFLGVSGHKEITSGPFTATSAARLAGFVRGWRAELADEHRIGVFCYGEGAAARVVPHYLSLNPRPAGVFAASDEIAIGFRNGALAHGLEAGKDYQLVGFDGQERGRQHNDGPLTTIEAPAGEMGRRAAELLAERLANPEQPVRRLSLGCSVFKGVTVREPARGSGSGA
jgi:DNA-binding LacI/PurR family transcriptional regulator/DNA-binding transcriptional regulator YhcF (GntR family)